MMLSLRPLLLRLVLLPVLVLPGVALAQGWLPPPAGQQPEFLEASDVFQVEASAGKCKPTLGLRSHDTWFANPVNRP